MQANSETIKYALMAYYRFKRGLICATECFNGDVVVYTKKKEWYEIEIKTSKSDMWRGEARKPKHKAYKNPDKIKYGFKPHRFYMAVPKDLVEEAEKWVEETNPDYGIIKCEFNDGNCTTMMYNTNVTIVRTAKKLHDREFTKGRMLESMMKRICSENINHMERWFRKMEMEEYEKRSRSKETTEKSKG